MRTRRFFRKIVGHRRLEGASEFSTSAIHTGVLDAIATSCGSGLTGNHLDVGSGTGRLLGLVREQYAVTSFACDYTDRWMRLPGQQVEIADVDRDPLPFLDGHFSLVTCIEVVEHIENFRALVREVFRVLKPGGVAVFSTPNILNLRSRLRYLSCGFHNLFGPVLLNRPDLRPGARGHISPINWFYFGHALASTGFKDLKVTVDKYQRRSFFVFPLLLLPLRLSEALVYRREEKKYKTMDESNGWMVRRMNSRDLLLGRTLIVSATKPDETA
jgi:SAM-dependent methyltransferase